MRKKDEKRRVDHVLPLRTGWPAEVLLLLPTQLDVAGGGCDGHMTVLRNASNITIADNRQFVVTYKMDQPKTNSHRNYRT